MMSTVYRYQEDPSRTNLPGIDQPPPPSSQIDLPLDSTKSEKKKVTKMWLVKTTNYTKYLLSFNLKGQTVT